ncbi:hypothetical protein L9F63_016536 [Diploptera punctata]|uniref:Uncharacterized protein n=1 Tax=Diploptera punctata TaxID=6984 RepID=A0AAD8A0V5_DIPPU|nr:hypothetical protein L9F63_016536 [Diploptera punctata]
MRRSLQLLSKGTSFLTVKVACTAELSDLKCLVVRTPREVLNIIALDSLLIIDKLIVNNERAAISIGNVNYLMISSYIMNLVLFPCMEHLDVTKLKSEYSQRAVMLNLQYLEDVLVLKLPENCPLLSTFTSDIKYIKKLENLQLLKSCTNDMIKELGENCPNMNYINISFSTDVENKCLPDLLNLKKITYLNISSTSISINTYKIILNKLKLITNISWSENYIEEILTDIDEEILKNKVTFEGKIKAPKILVERCPNIKSLTLETSEIIDLTPISEFCNLENITLNGVNFALCNLENIFRGLGSMLRDLYLKSVEDLKISTIIECCERLQSLSIENCKFSSDEINTVPSMSHFLSLTKLSLMSNTGDTWYLNNVKYYKNLKSLNADSVDGFDDDFFKEAFENDAFKKLNEFAVRIGGRLSIRTANLLIDSCPDLKVIGYLHEWTGLNTLDTEKIVEGIWENNYNLKVWLHG